MQPNASPVASHTARFAALDGWRGLSILFVLAAHLLPLGPNAWQLNASAGPLGMVLFFTLSGFLICHFLLNHSSVMDFLIRRFFRIVPLAWLYMLIVLLITQASTDSYLAHLLFYANWPPMQLAGATTNMWSLNVEVQFYLSVTVLVALLGQRGLLRLPVLRVVAPPHVRCSMGSYIAFMARNKTGARGSKR